MEFELKYHPIVIILEGKKENVDYVINDQNPSNINSEDISHLQDCSFSLESYT